MGTALLLLILGASATVVIPAGRYRLGADDGRYDERPAAAVQLVS